MILTALKNYYEVLQEDTAGPTRDRIPGYGFSNEPVSYALVLSPEGQLVDVWDIRNTSGKKPIPAYYIVPKPAKRSANISPCFLWDKSSYTLGVSAKPDSRLSNCHQAFKDYHLQLCSGQNDLEFKALCYFLKQWQPEHFNQDNRFSQEMLDANFVFRLDGQHRYIHESSVAKALWVQQLAAETNEQKGFCLVSGRMNPIARLHSSIKGVEGSQSSGASLVAFNQDAFRSYQKEQGSNAPVSEEAAFAYTTALNRLTRKDPNNRQRLIIGDTTLVFWAKTPESQSREAAEELFAELLNPTSPTATEEISKLRDVLNRVKNGQPLQTIDPKLDPQTHIFLLGLSPNMSRLSVRIWQQGSLNFFAQRLASHYQDLYLEPCPWQSEPSIHQLLLETVPRRQNVKPKRDDIPPKLAGELTRAILAGSPYPRSLLSQMIMRMRADKQIRPLRVAICKAVLSRMQRLFNPRQPEIPVSLDTQCTDHGYLLGRLLSMLENIQQAALGNQLNATLVDRYYGAASATPARVFPALLRNTRHHFSRLRKDKPGLAHNLEQQLGDILNQFGTEFPLCFPMNTQGRFAIGYYHQNSARYQKPVDSQNPSAGDK